MEESGASSQSQGEVQSVLGFWQQFDLVSSRAGWDKTCEEMREFKSSSIIARKKLNDITKSFRSKNKEEQSLVFNDLLKAYQEEIDQLSRSVKLLMELYINLCMKLRTQYLQLISLLILWRVVPYILWKFND